MSLDFFDKELHIESNEVIQPNSIMMISDKGMPIKDSKGEYGDLYIEFKINYPEFLSQSEQEQIKDIWEVTEIEEDSEIESLEMKYFGTKEDYMKQKKELFTSVTELRTQASENYDKADPAAIKDHLSASSRLGTQMGKLMINMEDYPDLKSNETLIQAQQTYNEVEAQIAAARRFYNSSVTELNNTIEIFPGNLLAGIANSKIMPFFEADEAVVEPINATDYFK